MKSKLGLIWAWIVIAMFVGIMLYSFAYTTSEVLRPENRIGLVLGGLFLVFLLWKIFTSGYDKRMRAYFRNKGNTKVSTDLKWTPEDLANMYEYLVKAGQIKDNPPLTREQAINYARERMEAPKG